MSPRADDLGADDLGTDDAPAPEARNSLAHPEASERDAGRVGQLEKRVEPRRGRHFKILVVGYFQFAAFDSGHRIGSQMTQKSVRIAAGPS
jgi:hypothetical protein